MTIHFKEQTILTSLLCTKKERASQEIVRRTDIKQAYMGCQLFTVINQNKKDVSDEAYSI